MASADCALPHLAWEKKKKVEQKRHSPQDKQGKQKETPKTSKD
jgi:hypothetical protein